MCWPLHIHLYDYTCDLPVVLIGSLSPPHTCININRYNFEFSCPLDLHTLTCSTTPVSYLSFRLVLYDLHTQWATHQGQDVGWREMWAVTTGVPDLLPPYSQRPLLGQHITWICKRKQQYDFMTFLLHLTLVEMKLYRILDFHMTSSESTCKGDQNFEDTMKIRDHW